MFQSDNAQVWKDLFACGASCNLNQLEQDAFGRMCTCLRPDMAVKTVKDSAGQERPIKLGSKLGVSFSF